MPKDLRISESAYFYCEVCREPFDFRLPNRLSGTFVHTRCSGTHFAAQELIYAKTRISELVAELDVQIDRILGLEENQ